MLGNEELLFDEIYEKTKDCGRVQFVKLLMTKERENKQLKEDVSKFVNDINKLQKELNEENLECSKYAIENQELKEQVEECKDKINWYENFEVNKTIDQLRLKHNIQQKEFIKYLEDKIKKYKEYDRTGFPKDVVIANDLVLNSLQHTLQKFKEIIGVSDENNTKKRN